MAKYIKFDSNLSKTYKVYFRYLTLSFSIPKTSFVNLNYNYSSKRSYKKTLMHILCVNYTLELYKAKENNNNFCRIKCSIFCSFVFARIAVDRYILDLRRSVLYLNFSYIKKTFLIYLKYILSNTKHIYFITP